MGCLIDATHHRRVLDYIETGIEEGARLIHGGGVPDVRSVTLMTPQP